MIRIVKKSTLDKFNREHEAIHKSLSLFQQENSTLTDEVETLKSREEKLRKQLSESLSLQADAEAECQRQRERADYLEKLSVESESNEIILRISDDLESMTPVIRWKAGIGDKLYELGYLRDVDNASNMAIQLALMSIGFEALTQLVEAFEQPLVETD